MNNKALNTYLKKEMRRAKHSLSREEARCRASYPDWENDEYNLLDYKFIWGWTQGSSSVRPSFYTWEDFYVYYNRADKRYYFHVDTGVYRYLNKEAARYESERLLQIKEAFRNFLTENGILDTAPICFNDLQQDGAESLAQLYTKFCALVDGFVTTN